MNDNLAMERTFRADGSPKDLALYGAKLLLPVVGLVAVNVLLGFTAWVSAALAALGCALTAFALVGRGIWGKQLEVLQDSLVITKARGEQYRIRLHDITILQARTGAIVVAWQEAGRRKSMVMGRERFANQTWQGLSRTVSSLAIGGVGAA